MNKIVKQIQTELKKKGFDPGPIDGDIGLKTLSAMKEYLVSNTNPVVQNVKDVVQTVVEKVVPQPPVPEIDANTLKGRDRPLYVKKVLQDLEIGRAHV